MTNLEKTISEMKNRFSKVEVIVRRNCPELEKEFETYCNEALMARRELERSLERLNSGASILEIGGGILALSYQLSREGFRVSSVEPVGTGFSPIEKLMKCFEEQAMEEGLGIRLFRTGIEEISYDEKYDFVFSINVMEHLKDPYQVIKDIPKLLKTDACYRFICPNYDFPYEPHFSKLLFYRRKGAFFLPENRAMKMDGKYSDSAGLYASLNFITLREVRRTARSAGLRLTLNRQATLNLFRRAIDDPILRRRHRFLSQLVTILSFFHLDKFMTFVPANLQPVIDIQVCDSK
jgi:2-polyprenyl-3-methyl-5-hydroxy-6-metoxy-1,4-benzoquinol methylase